MKMGSNGGALVFNKFEMTDHGPQWIQIHYLSQHVSVRLYAYDTILHATGSNHFYTSN